MHIEYIQKYMLTVTSTGGIGNANNTREFGPCGHNVVRHIYISKKSTTIANS